MLEPEASPLYSDKLATLPPSLIVTAGCDPLRDMGAALAKKLSEIDISAEHINYPGLIHNFLGYAGIVPASLRAFDEICGLLAKQLHD